MIELYEKDPNDKKIYKNLGYIAGKIGRMAIDILKDVFL